MSHLFTSSSDGHLYDTRVNGWSHLAPLRRNYRRTFARIRNVPEFKATLRNGAYAWPGGYPLFFITSDGAPICFDCARKELRNIYSAIHDHRSDGWRVEACDINYEDADCYCDHCSKRIDPAYGD